MGEKPYELVHNLLAPAKPSLMWPDLILVQGVMACSISAEPKKGLVNCLYTTCSTATIVGSTNQIAVFKLIEFLACNVAE